jgi:hypothetical protein
LIGVIVLRGSISSLQSLVGILAGISSIAGAVYSAMQYVKPMPTVGEIVTVVRAAETDELVPGARVEVLTPGDALVATLTPAADGQARQTLKEGLYRVRITAPRFDAQARAIQVQPGATAELHFALAEHVEPAPTAGRKPDPDAPVTKSVSAARRFFRRLGF